MLKKLGKYEVIEELGKGAMGIVYKAYDPLMARYVALKTMSYSSASDPEFKKRFYKEAQAPGRLHHENIVIIYELNEDDGVPFIAMEFLDGSDLHRLIQSDYIFTLKKIIDILIQVCEGLQFAHQNGIIHRDVKPANIFLLKNGKVKIVDFGIAQISQSSLMTRTGMILGTPSYMSPEQVRCDPITGTSDQFGVGVILYELLTGRRPFDGDTYSTILYKILHEPAVPLREHYPTCPPELESLVMKILSKNPADRFSDLGSVARRLRKIEAELDQDMAMEATLSITRTPSGDQSLKIELIHRYMREGKFDLALRVLDKMKSLGEKPEILDALREDILEKRRLARIDELIGEGSSFFDDDHFELAAECFNEALALDPENPRVLEWIRKTHQRESEKRLRQTIQQYLDKGNRAVEQGSLAEALRIFGEALRLNPAAAEIAEKIKTVQWMMERTQQETRCRTLVEEARTLLAEGHREEARELCRQAREVLPDSAEAGRLLREMEEQEREETIQRTIQEMEALILKKRYADVLTLAAETIPRTGLDPRLQAYVRRSRWARRRLAVAAAIVVAALAVAGAVYLALRPGPPVAPTAPGVLVLDVRPAVELVRLTDRKTGRNLPLPDRATPLRLELPPGEYEIAYRNDLLLKDPAVERVTVRSGKVVTIAKNLPGFRPAEAIDEILSAGSHP